MIDILLNLAVVILIFVSLFTILVVLMQRGSTQAGMSAAMGGGPADQAFGAETNTVLTKTTQTATIIFFVMAFMLYLGFKSRVGRSAGDAEVALPEASALEQAAGLPADGAAPEEAAPEPAPAAPQP